jgi:hypothetical protein
MLFPNASSGLDLGFDFGAGSIDAAPGAGPLGALSESGPMDMEALVFAVMSLRLNATDDAITGQIDDMKKRLAAKDAYSARIQELNDLIGPHTEGNYVDVPDGFANEKLDYSVDDAGRPVSTNENGAIGSLETEGHEGHMKVDDLKAEVERLQGRLDSLNTDSEVAMMRLNQDVSRRQQITTLFSNMMSNFHGTEMAVINNIK